jgi:hypothetical protein
MILAQSVLLSQLVSNRGDVLTVQVSEGQFTGA